ncbi:MAG: trypsin-like peptidase domain-containing protein [Alphaproteobacteria bacterium]|nr:trypsin-like peptidase domain-containing protein [Alphaproteobacteria bacterium]
MKPLYLLILLCLWTTPSSAESLQEPAQQELSLEDVIESVSPAVVEIAVATTDGEQVSGAGFVVGKDGYVVTNAHVVENAAKTTIITTNEDEYSAKIIGIDSKTDVALLQADQPLGLAPAQFADSDNVRVGNTVFAIGNPYGLGNSVSLGIISAKERDISSGPYDNFLQTDAAINQGNSGGPLFNLQGEIIGMNTAIFSTDGRNQGLGFATPANIVQWVVNQLQKNGRVVRGWLGIDVGLVKAKEDPTIKQLAIVSMSEDSPAATAGLKVGDVIERLGNINLKNARLFAGEIAATKPDTILPWTVRRDGVLISADIKVAEMPQAQKENQPAEPIVVNDKNWVHLTELDAKGFYSDSKQRFIITEIDPNGVLAEKGIEVGQSLLSLNNKKVFGVEDLRVKIKEARDIGRMTLQFDNNGEIDTVIIDMKEEQ